MWFTSGLASPGAVFLDSSGATFSPGRLVFCGVVVVSGVVCSVSGSATVTCVFSCSAVVDFLVAAFLSCVLVSLVCSGSGLDSGSSFLVAGFSGSVSF